MTRFYTLTRCLAACLLTALTAQAQTIRYVSATGTNASPSNATSWATASASFNDVVSASSPGDQVWVKAGRYKPIGTPSRSQSFILKNGVAIYGGFVGAETTLSERIPATLTNPSSTTLSGEIGDLNTIADNVYHVVVGSSDATATAIFDGFVITGGNANGAAYPDLAGGGLYNRGGGSGYVGSPTVRNCLFISNNASFGGAVINEGYSGGISNPVFINCLFQNNSATDSGGGIYNFGNAGTSNPAFANCAFQNNIALNGGAMINDGSSNGTSNPTLTNCSFQGNTGSTRGGALYNYAPAPGTSSATLTNCILFGNGAANTISNNNGSASARYSLFEPTVTGYTSVTGNITTNASPFVGTTDIRLFSGSPAINTGDPATTSATGAPAAVGSTDLAGNRRFLGRIDMGAVEFCTVASRLYVRANATGTNSGLTWADAFTDLQSALTYPCSQSLTEIWVAGGTYKPTSTTARTASFVMLPGVAIYGGFAGSETSLNQRATINLLTAPPSTTLSGEIGNPASTTDNSYHVISNPVGLTTGTLDRTAILDGFVITGGNANSLFPDSHGGGMLNQSTGSGKVCSPTLRNCVFVGNQAANGGAIANAGSFSGDSSPTITACSFQSNTATTSGGAIYNEGSNSGNSSPTLTNCIFQRNAVTGGRGGAMFCSGNSSPQLTNCSFQSNTGSQGGALSGSGNMGVVLTNGLLFGNGGANTFDNAFGGTITLRYSLVEPTATNYINGPGNITSSASPFVSTTSIDIPGTSLAVNTGNPATTTATVGSTDLAARPRLVGCRVDMGAIEYQYTFTAPSRLYVAASQTATNGGDGQTWATAYKDLQSALTYGCSVPEIWVKAGLYKPTAGTDNTVSFTMPPGTAIYGGFAGSETNLSQRPAILTAPLTTTLSGEIGNPASTTDNSRHVIYNGPGLTTTAILDGFVVTGGYGFDIDHYGAGMYNNGSGTGNVCSPTIRNCLFVNNRTRLGAAIFNDGSYGGSSSPTILNCTFQGNFAIGSGGGIYNFGQSGASSPALVNCAFLNNTGGAVLSNGSTGGISSLSLTNCSFQGNTGGSGRAIYNDVGGSTTLTNCVLFGNGGASTFFNSTAGATTLRYSLIEPTVTGYTSGPGNITSTTSPFATTASPVLSATAVAINNGDPATTSATGAPAAVGTIDLVGNPRFLNGRIDMGACETSCPVVARLYVRSGATGGNTGLTWADAFTDLQMALAYSCAQNLTEIWVAAGRYKPTSTTGPGSRTISFAMLPGVAIYGGFAGSETSLNQRPAIHLTAPSGTTLSGDIGTTGNDTDNSFHVIYNPVSVSLSSSAILDGFVIVGGNASGSFPDNAGAGLYNNGSGTGNVCSPTIRNCLFAGNRAASAGAMFNAGYNGGNSSPVITNTVFQSNMATDGGGALYNAGFSSGNSSPRFTNCAFLGNAATNNGGGIYTDGITGNSNTVFTNCSFQGNTAANGGGFYNFTSSITLTNCVLFGNGGANTIINNNAATGNVAARYSLFESSVTGYSSVVGNITTTTSPFVSATSVVLSATTLAINNGDPTTTSATGAPAAVGSTDLAGNPRFVGCRVDMGAVEHQNVSVSRVYVAASQTATNGGDGLTWATAYKDLQNALINGCPPAEIWVAVGMYRPTTGTDRSISFAMRPNIAIYGGFGGTETALSQRSLTNPSSTTLSGDIGTVGSIADNSYHVISNPAGLTTTAILDGFVITAGNANGNGFPNDVGGGMYNNGQGSGNVCSPTIRNCSFQNNTANNGGAMYNYGGSGNSGPVLTNCSFQNNTANNGGAMFNDGLFGTSSPVLTNCSFQNNTANNGGFGGAIANFASSPVLTNCVLFGNGGTNTFVNSSASITTRYSFFESSITGYTTGPGNLTATTSPFASTATTRLRTGSPAINTGDPATTTATVGNTDLAGLPRFVGTLDMGPLEFQAELFTVKTGNWNDPTVWNVNRLPQPGDRARLKHAVTLPASYVGFVTTLVYDPVGRLIYTPGGRLKLGP